LLVSKKYLNAKFDTRVLDVWKNSHGKWGKLVSDQLYQTEKADSSNYLITPSSLPLDLTFSDKLLFSGNEAIVVDRLIPPKMNTRSSEKRGFQDEYYSDHDINYFLWIYKWAIE